jgi:hypothetical protein
MHVILAHGALGAWDEIIFISIASVFIIMMGISWIRSRTIAPPDDGKAAPTTPSNSDNPPETPDRFRLE